MSLDPHLPPRPPPTKLMFRVSTAIVVALTISYSLWIRALSYNEVTEIRQALHSVVLGDHSSLVNVFVGTTGPGHVFPGATVPHGMVKVGMDTDSPENHAGYDAKPLYYVTGFSQLHDDGTGGWVPLQNFKLFPLPSCTEFTHCPTTIRGRKVLRKVKNVLAKQGDGTEGAEEQVADDEGSPGYFATNLASGVRVELTATRRTALHKYTFPAYLTGEDGNGEDSALSDWKPHIILDLTNQGHAPPTNRNLTIDPITGRLRGGARFASSFGRGDFQAYVCVDFKGDGFNLGPPLEYGVYSNTLIYPNATSLQQHYGEEGAILTFPHDDRIGERQANGSTTILARVGVSLISESRACENAEEEIPDFDFEYVRDEARNQWSELLGRFQVLGGDRESTVLFYSSLYRSHIVPADYSDENPLWLSTSPYYDSLYCNWDTYRTLFPLMSLHDPTTFSRVVQSFIDVQQHEGWMPECRGATVKQWVQGGSDGDPILAEFYVKFRDHLGAFNVSDLELYTALVQDAEVEPPDWDTAGRQAEAWKKYGYIPVYQWPSGGTDTRQVSRTLEYAFDDFTISQVAKGMGLTEDAAKYANRSRGFENVWNPETTIEGGEEAQIRGFMQPRYANGTFGKTDPRHCTVHDPFHSTCYLDGMNKDGFYEGGPIVYSQYVPHDTARLIQLQGGDEAFIKRLDFIFDNDYFDSTNEPSQQIPFMYHYANRPGLSTERSRQTITRWYNTSINGLPGNDDSGAMGSYVAFYLLGLYPLPATRQMLISSPYFPKVTIRNPFFNSTTTINAIGFEGNPPDGKGKVYVSSVKINGIPWKSTCYLEWDVFEAGATIDMELSTNRTLPCGDGPDALPPSLSTGGYDLF